MREKFMVALDEAIDNGNEINVSLDTGKAVISVSFIPEILDFDGNSVHIWFNGMDFLVLDLTDIDGNEDEMIFQTDGAQIEF